MNAKLFSILFAIHSSTAVLLAQSFTSSNLPIVIINTEGQSIPNEPKIAATMSIIDNGVGVRNSITDPFNNYNGKIGIEVRGSSSQSFPKKQYGIELRDDAGVGISASLLGMPAEEDWVLFAPYNDKSLMRDVLAYKLGRDMGSYAPRTRYCELILNGQYDGIYVLMEKIKRDPNRVNIAKLTPDENSGDDLTGGYIIKIDKESGSGNGGWFSNYTPNNRSSNQKIYFQYDYPSAATISSAQRTYINQFIDRFESSLISSTFNDPVNGYSKYINSDSFIDFYIMNELSKNVDGYRLSTYLHKDKDSDGGKLHMGPIWDFNLGFGNADYCTQGTTEGWVTGFNAICSQDFWLIPFWWDRLYQDGRYRNKLAARWVTLRETKFQTQVILDYIDSLATVLNVESQQRNFQRWPVLGQYVWPNFYVGPTFAAEVSWLKNWVTGRLAFMDTFMPKLITSERNNPSYLHVQVYPNPCIEEVIVQYTLSTPGSITFELMDALGRPVQKFYETKDEAGVFQSVWDVKNLSAGSYYYRAISGNEISNGKLIKRNP